MEFILAPLIVLFYFLPAIVGRKKRNTTSITVFNLFLGWTVIGWIIALVWAVSEDKNETQLLENTAKLHEEQKRTNDFLASQVKNSISDELKNIQQMRMNGTLTEDEYEKLRNRIINGNNAY